MINYLQLAQDVIDGEESALKALGILREMEKDIKQCIKMVDEEAQVEAQSWGEKTFETQGFQFTVKEGSRRYDFKDIPAWRELKDKIDDVEASAKDSAVQAEKGKTMIDDDGEIVQPAKISYTKSSISCKKLSE